MKKGHLKQIDGMKRESALVFFIRHSSFVTRHLRRHSTAGTTGDDPTLLQL